MRNLCVRANRLAISVVLLLLSAPLGGWASSSEIAGRVLDPSGAVIVEAQVTATNVATNIKRTTTTTEQGIYRFLHLPPGEYNLRVSHAGFRATDVLGVVVHVTQAVEVNITLRLGSVVQTVTVEGGRIYLGNQGGEVGTVIDRQFVENLPLNGRSFQTLIELTPGVVLTPASNAAPGQFSVNGQRSNANSFIIDGVSANIGVTSTGILGQNEGGSLPAFTASGGTNNLVSIDAMEEFRIQTSTYAPEFGRQPGGQISIVTRSGTNQFHGTLFNFFRNDKLDGNDWFANSRGGEKAALRQNDFGGVIGGPIVKDRTFFFFSYEGLRLRQPRFSITTVPSAASRQLAPPETKPILDAFPLPNGPDLGGETAEFSAAWSLPSSFDAYSLKLDQSWGKWHLFGRYNHSPSDFENRIAIFNEAPVRSKTQTLTAGATVALTPNIVNDFRGNWSKTRAAAAGNRTLPVSGAIPPADSALLPSFTSSEDALFFVNFSGMAFLVGKSAANRQQQFNFLDTLSVVKGSHQLKVGVDFRRLSPFLGVRSYQNNVFFLGVSGVISGTTFFTQVAARETELTYTFNSLSLFAQDTWKATPRLTLTYGLRWEYNPPPSEKNGNLPYTVVGLDDPATMTLAPQGTPLWNSTSDNFAPRAGVAYHLSRSQGIVLRGGVGLFYDLGNGPALTGATRWPYQRSKLLFFAPFPLDDASAQPPPISLDPPFGQLNVSAPNLKLPYSAQWNLALEKSLGPNQTISATYVAQVSRRLLRQERLVNINNPDFTIVFVARNSASSDYHAGQFQFQRRLSRGLQALVSYAWSHAIDDISSDSLFDAPVELLDLDRVRRASSDFDVRHSFTAAVTYNIPTPAVAAVGKAVLGNWSIDTILRARSGTPIDILAGNFDPLVGTALNSRPDLVPGEPIWIDDPSVAAGKRLNRNAFNLLPQGERGNLGRNALKGFGMSQVDFSLRRQFTLSEGSSLQFRAEFFNILNHPNFSNPDSFLLSGTFGTTINMLGRGLGVAGTGGGLNPLYQIGGPRSIQFALKIIF